MCSGTERGWAELVFLERGARPPAQGQGVPVKHVVWGRCHGPHSWALTSIAHGHVTLGKSLYTSPGLCLQRQSSFLSKALRGAEKGTG